MGKSDAELREAVIAGWHRLESEVRSNPDRLAGLVALTGIPFRKLDLVRQVRNRIAHPDEPVPRERLLSALRIIADAELRLAARQQKPKRRPTTKRTGQATQRKPAARKPAQRPRGPQRRGPKAGPAKRTRGGSPTVVITVVVLVAVAIAAAVLLLG